MSVEIAAPHIGNLLVYADLKGMPTDIYKNMLNAPEQDVCYAENIVTTEEFEKVFSALVKESKDPYFGLHYGCFLNLKALGFVLDMALNASTIEQAVFLMQQYFQTAFPLVELTAATNEEKYKLTLTIKNEASIFQKHLGDAVFSFIYRELTLMIDKTIVPQIIIPHKKINLYRDRLKINVENGAAYQIIFDVNEKSLEINKKRTRKTELLVPHYLKLLELIRPHEGRETRKVRNMILHLCKPEFPSLKELEIHYPGTSRTLQRKLRKEGTTYKYIVKTIRKELIKMLKTNDRLSTQDIAYLLGYGSSAAYIHALKNDPYIR